MSEVAWYPDVRPGPRSDSAGENASLNRPGSVSPWQQDMGATEWIGGQPTDSILTGWSYASVALAHCDQAP
jgi:hypothetical protein